MKKFPDFRRLIAFLLVFQMLLLPAIASEAESETDSSVEDSSELASSEITSEAPQEDFSYPIPENISGDASVSAGCISIDGAAAITNETDLPVKLGAALMYEMNSGTLLYGYNVDEKMYPASVTKIMTCLLALEHGNLDDIVTVSESVVANRDPDGSDCKLRAGEQISLHDLLYCLMVASANDAASAISEHIAGSEAAFVEMMNEKAAQLGCGNTHFVNPHGLHDDDHYTCARDLAKIMLAALEYDAFNEIYSTKRYEVPATNKSKERNLLTTNYLMDKATIEYYYDERVIGGKTGYTTPAGRCLAAVSETRGLRLLTVVLGGDTSLNDRGVVNYYSFEETGNLIDFAAEGFTEGLILSPDAVLASFPVTGGENQTQAAVKEAVSMVVPADLTPSQLYYEFVLDDGTLTAPIEKGDPLGVVRVWYRSSCLAQEEIYALADSEVKTAEPTDPAIGNAAVEEGQDIWQFLLIIVLVLLALITFLIAIVVIRNHMIRVRRQKRRENRRRGQ